MACVVYELAALRAPFEAKTLNELRTKIKSGRIERLPSQYSDELFIVIQKMMDLDDQRRPSVNDLMVHPKICFMLRNMHLGDMRQNIGRKQQQLKEMEKTLKEKEKQMEKLTKEIEEKENFLNNWETQLKQRKEKLTQKEIEMDMYSP